jgi:Flp pilus assembly pilin Flp
MVKKFNCYRKTRQFIRDRKGVAAVEFVMLAPVFFLVVFSSIEVSLISLGQVGMRAGISETSRMVRTGNGQCLNHAQAIQKICTMAFVPDCEANTKIILEVFPEDMGGDSVEVGSFAALNPKDIVLLRAAYDWDIFSPWLGLHLGEGEGAFTIEQSSVFHNEEFAGVNC